MALEVPIYQQSELIQGLPFNLRSQTFVKLPTTPYLLLHHASLPLTILLHNVTLNVVCVHTLYCIYLFNEFFYAHDGMHHMHAYGCNMSTCISPSTLFICRLRWERGEILVFGSYANPASKRTQDEGKPRSAKCFVSLRTTAKKPHPVSDYVPPLLSCATRTGRC